MTLMNDKRHLQSSNMDFRENATSCYIVFMNGMSNISRFAESYCMQKEDCQAMQETPKTAECVLSCSVKGHTAICFTPTRFSRGGRMEPAG